MFWLCVVLRILANPISNVFQKSLGHRGIDALFIIVVTHAILSVACLPIVVWYGIPWSHVFWLNMGVSAIFNVLGNTLIVHAVRVSDLSVVGPINAFKPVVSLLPSFLFLGEVPDAYALLGITLIVAGSFFIIQSPAKESDETIGAQNHRLGIQLRVAALVISGLEAVFLKRALAVSSTLPTFALWSILGLVLAAAVHRMKNRTAVTAEHVNQSHSHLPIWAALAMTTGAMQLSTIFILAQFQVGPALALFQISAVLSVLLGNRLFQEKNLGRRLIGATTMVAGAITIILSQHALAV